jgi:4-amino-4-deoxy-L-arabinose transferase-like glycosyltransferase
MRNGMSETSDMPAPVAATPQAAPAPSSPEGPAPADRAAAPARRRALGLSALVDLPALCLLTLVLVLPGALTLPSLGAGEDRALLETARILSAGGLPDPVAAPVAWLQALAASLGTGLGLTTLALMRLPSIAAALVVVLATYAIGRIVGGRIVGLAAGALVAATVLLGVAGRVATSDAVFAAGVALAFAGLAGVWMDREPARRLARTAAFWLGTALAFAAGGAAAVPALVPALLAILLVDRSAARFAALDPVKGLILIAVLLGPWIVALATGAAGFALPSWPGLSLAGAPPGTQLAVAILSFWPLSALVPLAFALSRRTPEARRATTLLLAWIVPGWLVLEVLPGKHPEATLPYLPAVAVLVGLAVPSVVEHGRRWSVRLGFGVVGAGAVLAAFGLDIAFVLGEVGIPPRGLILAVLLGLAGAGATLLWRRDRPATAFAATLVAAGLLALLAYEALLPSARSLAFGDRVATAIAARAPCPEPAVILVGDPDPSVAARFAGAERHAGPGSAAEAFKASGCAVAVVPRHDEALFRAAAGLGPPDDRVAGPSLAPMGLRRAALFFHRPAP